MVAITPSGYLVDNQAVILNDPEALQSALARRRAADGPSAIVVVAPPQMELRDILEVGRAAHRAKVRTLYLGVRRKVAENPPPGDVQASLAHEGVVWRIEGIPFSLRLLGSKQRAPAPRDVPKSLGYDARQASVGLAVSLRPGKYQLSTVDGILPPTDLIGLQPALLQLHKAHPQQMSLIVAAAQRLRYAELVKVAVLSRFHGVEPLFPGLALTRLHRIQHSQRDMASLVAALSNSRVDAAPHPGPTFRPFFEGVHRCYRIALRRAFAQRRPWPDGTVVLGPGQRPAVTGGPAGNPQLLQCIRSLAHRGPKSPPAPLTLRLSVPPSPR